MKNLKSIYLRNLVKEMLAHKGLIVLCACICAVVFAGIGYKKAAPAQPPSQAEIEEYNRKLGEYDQSIQQLEENLAIAEGQVEELQEYVDHSIYMKLDPQNIQVSSAQYAVLDSGNTNNVLAALVGFINDGGLREPLSSKDADLDVKYWGDIISCNSSGNVLNVVVMHYDAQKAKDIREIAQERLYRQIPEVANAQGEFRLVKTDEADYVKTDIGIANAQNGHLNNLKGYKNNQADFSTKIINTKNAKAAYAEDEKPAAEQPGNQKKVAAKYLVFGLILGAVLPGAFLAFRYLLSNRILSREDLANAKVPVLGTYSNKKGYVPSLERCIIDIDLWRAQYRFSELSIIALSAQDEVKKVIGDYMEQMDGKNFPVSSSYHVEEDAAELKQVIAAGCCILCIQTGITTYTQLERHLELCDKFGVRVLGCIIVE